MAEGCPGVSACDQEKYYDLKLFVCYAVSGFFHVFQSAGRNYNGFLFLILLTGISAVSRKEGRGRQEKFGKGVDDLAQKDQVNRPTGKALETMKKILRSRFITTAHVMFGRDVEALTKAEIYKTIAATAKQSISDNWIKTNNQLSLIHI